jgi:DNA-binding transcriptional regulator YiaG
MAKTWTAEALKKLRSSLGITQRQLAILLDVSTGSVRNWEQKIGQPTGPAAILLDQLLDNPGPLLKRLDQSNLAATA